MDHKTLPELMIILWFKNIGEIRVLITLIFFYEEKYTIKITHTTFRIKNILDSDELFYPF
ncbi:hypothetical protein JCM17380_39290 [Desulfosporosinus burensis]